MKNLLFVLLMFPVFAFSQIGKYPASISGSYQSEYKTYGEREDEGLALKNLEEDSYYWSFLPKYCSELDKRIPEFKDKVLKKHARSYAGQVCDLYLSTNSDYLVDKKSTIDAIRYEENYFRNTKIDKKDQKQLNEFLNGLD